MVPALINPTILIYDEVLSASELMGALMRVLLMRRCNFLGTERHLRNAYVASLVTARNSGSSFLNRVELQNGCLALGHSNHYMYHPPLAGTNIDGKTGKLHAEKY